MFSRLRVAIAPLAFALAVSSAIAQTVEQWREDLQFLRNSVVQDYPQLFHSVSQADWEQAVADLDRRLPELQRHEVIAELSRLVAMFRIGHTHLQLGYWRGPEAPARFHTIPLLAYVYSDGVYVQCAAPGLKRWLGARIVRIGPNSMDQVFDKIRTSVVCENEMGFRSAVPFYLSCPEILHACGVIDDPARIVMTIDIAGEETEVSLDAQPAQPLPGLDGIQYAGSGWIDACQLEPDRRPLWLRNLNQLRDSEFLPGHRLLYVRHSAVVEDGEETIEAFFDRLLASDAARQADRLVLDLRLNGGGNLYLNAPVITGLIRSKFNQRGRLFVIIGRRTFSACQHLVNELQKYTAAIFVGEPTGERVNFWGDTRGIVLPNSKLTARLSWLWWQSFDPRDRRPWTAPDVFVELSHEQFRDGIDPALDAILTWQPCDPPDQVVIELLKQKGPAAVREYARQLMADPRNRFALSRAELRIVDQACDLLYGGSSERGVELCLLNVDLFPDSAAAHENYALALLAQGDKSAAIAQLEQAIALDPLGPTRVSATRKLQHLREQ